MSDEQQQDPCAVSPNPNESNESASPALATSIAPSVYVEDVVLEGAEPENTTAIVNLSFVEGISSPEALRWYDDGNYRQFLRVRVVGCFGTPNSAELDFISQRMNEYSEDLMNTQGQSGALEFIYRLMGSTSPQLFPDIPNSLISEDFARNVASSFTTRGPLDVQTLTRDMQQAHRTTAMMGLNFEQFDNLIVYDSPIEDLLDLDPSGSQIRQITPQVMTTGAGDDAESQQHYITEKAFLKPIVFRLNPTEEERNNGASTIEVKNHLSLYAFMYFDYEDFFTEYNVTQERRTVEQDRTGLELGMGFINSATFLGRKNFFEPQKKGEFPLGPINPQSRTTSAGTRLQDLRNTVSQAAPLVDHGLFQTIGDKLAASGLDTSSQKIIKKKDYFSPFWISRDSTDSARFLFAFDKTAFLSSNSLFPALYQNSGLAAELLTGGEILDPEETVSILHVNAKKRRIHFEGYGGSANGLSVLRNKPTGDEYRTPETVVENISRVPELSLASESLDFYEGVDSYAEAFKAQDIVRYEYGVELAIHDPCVLFLQKLNYRIRGAEQQVRQIYEMIVNSPPLTTNEMTIPRSSVSDGVGLYDRSSGRRTTDLGSIYLEEEVTAEAVILQAIRLASRYISLIAYGSGDNNPDPSVLDLMTNLINSPNPQGIQEAANVIMNFGSYLDKTLQTVLPENPTNEPELSKSEIFQGSNQSAILRVDKYFENIFEYGRDYGNGYDYIFGEDDYVNLSSMAGLPRISRNDFITRLTQEFSKYFGLQTPSQGLLADSPFGASADIFANPSYQFISPKSIRTYGAPIIDQTRLVRNMTTNEINYDIDRYAKLFADLAKIKRSTRYLNYPYYYLQNSQGLPEEGSPTVRPILQNLIQESCVVRTGVAEKDFVSLDTSEDRGGPTSLRMAPGATPLQLEDEGGVDLLSSLLGNLATAEEGYTRRTTSDIESDNSESEENLETPAVAQHPIKLLFGIFGEMTLTHGRDTTYKDIAQLANSLGLQQGNIIAALEGNQKDIPNQYKAMLVMGSAQNTVSIGPAGLQAVRVKLDDIDLAVSSKSIGVIQQGDESPPYTLTNDPMKIFSKFATFWMNYKQLAVIEYLGVFTPPSNNIVTAPGTPKWQKFIASNFINSNPGNLLCRIRPIGQGDIPEASGLKVDKKDLFDLNIYNQYFILESAGN